MPVLKYGFFYLCLASLGLLGLHAFAAQHQAILRGLPSFPFSGGCVPERSSSPPVLTPISDSKSGKERHLSLSKSSVKSEREVSGCIKVIIIF